MNKKVISIAPIVHKMRHGVDQSSKASVPTEKQSQATSQPPKGETTKSTLKIMRYIGHDKANYGASTSSSKANYTLSSFYSFPADRFI